MNLEDYIQKQIDWSEKTFGDHPTLDSILNHLKEELEEVRENPLDPYEWIDIIILALEGAWRQARLKPDQIVEILRHKQAINSQRKWPDVTNYPKGVPIKHQVPDNSY